MVETSKPKSGEEKEPLTRLNMDIPLRLHTRIKVASAEKGKHMKDVIVALLEEHFPGPSA